MTMMKCKARSKCPISLALDIFGDKWSLLIIRDIMFFNKNTYGDFIESEEKIATNILADRLSMLERVGILTKDKHPKSRAKHFYKLTPKGIDLMPTMMEIIVWSDKYNNISEEARVFALTIRKCKHDLIRQISAGLK